MASFLQLFSRFNIIIYFIKRLFLMIPTLLGILIINFAIIQITPGGPIQQVIAKMRSSGTDVDIRLGGAPLDIPASTGNPTTTGDTVDADLIKKLEKQFGFDKPWHERFFKMVKDYATFDFGKSYFKGDTVSNLILSKLPVSVSLGLWSTLFIYLLSIPLGISKALKHGSRFDGLSSTIIILCYAIPSFLLALLFIVLFAGGSFWTLFPLRGLTSESFGQLSVFGKIKDYLWHIVLPVTSIVVGGFAKLSLMTKNSFLEEIHKQYVITAKAKGLSEKKVLYSHVFRNAMLVLIADFPALFGRLFFTHSLLIEVLFSLDGLGLLGFESAMSRDYPVIFASLFIFTLIGLCLTLIGDLLYMIVDPRIDLTKKR